MIIFSFQNLAFMNLYTCLSCGLLFVLAACSPNQNRAYEGWEVYGGTKDQLHYSSLREIDTTNVGQLKIAWTYQTGDAIREIRTQIQCNPIIIEGVLYGTTARMKLFAVDAATGIQKWVFDPELTNANSGRGVTYWKDGKGDSRLFYTAGDRLYCINAANGFPVPEFGYLGSVDLHDGLERDVKDRFITSNTPGVIYKDLLILGTRVAEDATAAPGHIRAYDVRTGEIRWIFHTVPHPGEFGYDTWPDKDAWKHLGGANCWAGMSLDVDKGIVFVPTGSLGFDFYGGKRAGDNLFANCILALDAATGNRIWHYQTIHHDLWDRDLPTPPVLLTLQKDGNEIEAIAQPTKSGFIFLLDRATGKPVYPIEEVRVPTDSDLAGEVPSLTQPVPTFPKPFVRQVLTESDLNDLVSDSSYQDLKNRLTTYKTGNMFNTPSKAGTVIFPGFDGGAEWGGPAYDPTTGIMYINANECAWVLTMVDVNT